MQDDCGQVAAGPCRAWRVRRLGRQSAAPAAALPCAPLPPRPLLLRLVFAAAAAAAAAAAVAAVTVRAAAAAAAAAAAVLICILRISGFHAHQSCLHRRGITCVINISSRGVLLAHALPPRRLQRCRCRRRPGQLCTGRCGGVQRTAAAWLCGIHFASTQSLRCRIYQCLRLQPASTQRHPPHLPPAARRRRRCLLQSLPTTLLAVPAYCGLLPMGGCVCGCTKGWGERWWARASAAARGSTRRGLEGLDGRRLDC